MTTTSPQDRIVTGFSLAVGPLLLAGILAVLKKPTASAVLAGLGVTGGVLGAVAPQWFLPKPGPSRLAKYGWPEGLPSWDETLATISRQDDAALQAEVNLKLMEAGGYAYGDGVRSSSDPTIVASRRGVLDSGQRLQGVGGFWALR